MQYYIVWNHNRANFLFAASIDSIDYRVTFFLLQNVQYCS